MQFLFACGGDDSDQKQEGSETQELALLESSEQKCLRYPQKILDKLADPCANRNKYVEKCESAVGSTIFSDFALTAKKSMCKQGVTEQLCIGSANSPKECPMVDLSLQDKAEVIQQANTLARGSINEMHCYLPAMGLDQMMKIITSVMQKKTASKIRKEMNQEWGKFLKDSQEPVKYKDIFEADKSKKMYVEIRKFLQQYIRSNTSSAKDLQVALKKLTFFANFMIPCLALANSKNIYKAVRDFVLGYPKSNVVKHIPAIKNGDDYGSSFEKVIKNMIKSSDVRNKLMAYMKNPGDKNGKNALKKSVSKSKTDSLQQKILHTHIQRMLEDSNVNQKPKTMFGILVATFVLFGSQEKPFSPSSLVFSWATDNNPPGAIVIAENGHVVLWPMYIPITLRTQVAQAALKTSGLLGTFVEKLTGGFSQAMGNILSRINISVMNAPFFRKSLRKSVIRRITARKLGLC